MSKKREATREDARRILRNGILDMSVERLIQMTNYGLVGYIELRNEFMLADNTFNHMDFIEENRCISFSIIKVDEDYCYGSISFLLDSIMDISGYEDKEKPDEYLHIKIKLENETNVDIKILY